ncbi:MAG: DUF1761 family protein [Saprospiraceae bacterium]|nr:DUF1761 family protein [Saprospiraceae bacterium]
MNTKKLIFSTVVIFIMYVLMDLTFYGLFEEKMAGKADRPASEQNQLLPFIFFGLFLASFLFSYLFDKLSDGEDKIREGTKYRIILGTFMYLPLFLIFYATRDTRPLDAWLINAAFHIIQFGIFGIVVAYIRGKVIIDSSGE